MRRCTVRAGVVVCCMLPAIAHGHATAHWRRLADTPGFPGLHEELQSIVDDRPGARTATFCVVLGDDGDGDPLLYVLWPDAHLLYRWEATTEAQLDDETLLLHEPLDLRHDIVRTAADRLSTYKVEQAWVDNVAAQCRAHGEQVHVVRKQR